MNTPRTTMALTQLILAITLLSAACRGAQAAQITGKTLVSSCQELIAIYNKNGEQRLLAGVSTSVAEAMRAGICRGMIEEHANHSSCHRNWHAMASTIGEFDSDADIEGILDIACAK